MWSGAGAGGDEGERVDGMEIHLSEGPGESREQMERWELNQKGGGTVEDEEAGLFLLMTSSRGFSEKSEPQTESYPANSIAVFQIAVFNNIDCIVQSFNTVSLLLNCALPFYTFQKRIIIIVLLTSLLLQLCCNSEL